MSNNDEYGIYWSWQMKQMANQPHLHDVEPVGMRYSRMQSWMAVELARQCVSAVNAAESLGPFTEDDVQREYVHRKAYYDGQAEFIAKKVMAILSGEKP